MGFYLFSLSSLWNLIVWKDKKGEGFMLALLCSLKGRDKYLNNKDKILENLSTELFEFSKNSIKVNGISYSYV